VKDLFLCHAGVDKDWVEGLGADVEAEVWNDRPLTVFIDKWDIDVGDNIVVKINEALAHARFVAVVMSPEMVGSEWCQAEVSTVLMSDPTNRRKRLIPIRRRDVHLTTGERLEIPPLLASLNYLDFRGEKKKYAKEFQRLLARLRGEAPPRGGRRRRARRSVDSSLLTALPSERVDPDAVGEALLGNLLPVREIPGVIWSARTSLRKKSDLPTGTSFPPCVLREGRLYTFCDLSEAESAFASLIDPASVQRDAVADWRDNEDRWRWVMNLMNQTLRKHLGARGVAFDGAHNRFYFRPKGAGRVTVTWGTGQVRTVVRPPDPGKAGAWVHQGARFRFETVGSSVYLSIDPLWVFTKDGREPVDRDRVGPLAMQWSGRERNGAVLRHVLMWSDFLTAGKKETTIPAGGQHLVIGRLPLTVQVPVGIPTDQVAVRSLLRFTQAELDLDVPRLVRQFAVSSEPRKKCGVDDVD